LNIFSVITSITLNTSLVLPEMPYADLNADNAVLLTHVDAIYAKYYCSKT